MIRREDSRAEMGQDVFTSLDVVSRAPSTRPVTAIDSEGESRGWDSDERQNDASTWKYGPNDGVTTQGVGRWDSARSPRTTSP